MRCSHELSVCICFYCVLQRIYYIILVCVCFKNSSIFHLARWYTRAFNPFAYLCCGESIGIVSVCVMHTCAHVEQRHWLRQAALADNTMRSTSSTGCGKALSQTLWQHQQQQQKLQKEARIIEACALRPSTGLAFVMDALYFPIYHVYN